MKFQVLFGFLKQGLILKMPSAAFLVWTITLESVLNRKERGKGLRNRSALAVSCCVIIHCLVVSCKEDQITRFNFVQLTDTEIGLS